MGLLKKQLKGAQLNVPEETNGAGPGSGHPALSPSTLHFFQKSFALGFTSPRSRVPAPAGCTPWDCHTLLSDKTLFFPCNHLPEARSASRPWTRFWKGEPVALPTPSLPRVPSLAAHSSCCRSPVTCPGVATATGSSPGANDRAGGRGEGCRSVAGAEGSWLERLVQTSPRWLPGTMSFARWIPALLEVSRTPCCL